MAFFTHAHMHPVLLSPVLASLLFVLFALRLWAAGLALGGAYALAGRLAPIHPDPDARPSPAKEKLRILVIGESLPPKARRPALLALLFLSFCCVSFLTIISLTSGLWLAF